MKVTRLCSSIQKALKEKVLEYSICENESENGKFYGIQLSSNSQGCKEKIIIEYISDQKNIVTNLINILYENSICTIHFRDIVEDYIDSLNQIVTNTNN